MDTIEREEPLGNATYYLFDSSTQFTLDNDAIALRQGSVYIASGQFADWLLLFQPAELGGEPPDTIRISEAIEYFWLSDHESIMIYDSKGESNQLQINQKDLPVLENRLIELGQGCCDPSPFNFVADIAQEPDEILGLIQKITNMALSPEQVRVAKESIADLPIEIEITFLDLHQLWEEIPALSSLSKALRFYFLPE